MTTASFESPPPAPPPLFARSRPYWLLIALACLVPAVLDALQAYAQARLGGQTAVPWDDVIFRGSEWLFLGALTPITYVLARRFPLRRADWKRTLAAHLVGAIALCVGWASLGVLLGMLLHRYPGQGDLRRAYPSWVLTSLPWSVFMYFAVLGCVYAFTYFLEAREREAQRSRLAAQLAEARLAALRMQLNPHFLFNSLNAIAVLVRDQNTSDASRMLELLGAVLRQVLHGEARQEVTLAEELQFIERYLAIEQVRFSDRLRVRWLVDEAARDALVPEFVLQPVVENAVRHGVAKRSEAGTIEVRATIERGDLVLTVVDDGPGYPAEAQERQRAEGLAARGPNTSVMDSDAGVGLTNTRARLATLFGDAARLEIERSETGGTRATIRLPARRRVDE